MRGGNMIHNGAKKARLSRTTQATISLLIFFVAYATLSTSPIIDLVEYDMAPREDVNAPRHLREQVLVKKNEESTDSEDDKDPEEDTEEDEVEGKDNDTEEENSTDPNSQDVINLEEMIEKEDSDESNRAIILISFGQEASESTLLERCILSIRRRGAFDGRVVVLTDAPEDRYAGEFDENVLILKAEESDILYGYYKSPAMKYKRFKTMIIDYISTAPELKDIDWLYYIDIDMMLGSSFVKLIQKLHAKYLIDSADDTPALYMFEDPHVSKFGLNSGFIIVNRHTSQPCLEVWRDEIDEHPNSFFDQFSLNEVSENKEANNCKLVGMDPNGYVTFPGSDARLNRIIRQKSHAPLIHIFNSCFAKRMSPEIMNKFVGDVLQLTEEELDEHKFDKAVITATENKWTEKIDVNEE